FFFFQAEDGIRDLIVTGVQTCALPISAAATTPTRPSASATMSCICEITGDGTTDTATCMKLTGELFRGERFQWEVGSECSAKRRSEERRVGKEGRAGGGLVQ